MPQIIYYIQNTNSEDHLLEERNKIQNTVYLLEQQLESAKEQHLENIIKKTLEKIRRSNNNLRRIRRMIRKIRINRAARITNELRKKYEKRLNQN